MAEYKKILTANTLAKKLKSLRKRKEIAFTNGCFDILHIGHVRYLAKAKKKNRILVLGLNSDASIRRIKGNKRPIVKQDDRAQVLAALEMVDYICIFNEDTPYKLIKKLNPKVLIKGADWKGKEVVGSDIVKENGGRVELIKYEVGKSTTNIIKAVLDKCQK